MRIVFPSDHHVINQMGISYRPATLKPSEPVLLPDRPWEGPRVNLYGSVYKTNRGYEMFYQCGNAVRIGYALSPDGLVWEKPMLNVADFSPKAPQVILANNEIDPANPPTLGQGQQLTNLVAAYHMPSVIYEPDSDAPYKMFVFGQAGYHVLRSKTGYRFEEYPESPTIPFMVYDNRHTGKKWCSDVGPCFKDRVGYTAMVKTYHVDAQGRTRRCVGRSHSPDFRHWSPVETVWVPGEEDDAVARTRGLEWADFYGLCPFFHGEGYLAYLWLFEIDHELPHGTHQGKMEAFLAYSADGINWRRLGDTAFIPWDLNFGEEGGMITTASAPIFDEDEIKIYYSDSNYDHGMFEKDFKKKVQKPQFVIRCAQLPRERLVAAVADDLGTLELRDTYLKPGHLRLNVACKKGWIQLDYLNDGDVMATQQVKAIDATDHWLDLPVSGQVSLRITLYRASLYALEFDFSSPRSA